MQLTKELPKISVITASYNYENYIKETIESVLNQDYSNWELIIVDDGSKDNSIDVIKSYCKKDDRIKLYTHENNINKGLIETIKLGLKMATSEWIAFLESDDTFSNNNLSKKVKIINEYPSAKFIFNNVNLFGDEEKIKQYEHYFSNLKKILNNKKYPLKLNKYFLKTNFVPTFSCVMIKKELFNNIDFNSPIPPCLDYYLYAQMSLNKFYYIDEKLTNWRIHKSYIEETKKVDKKTQEAFNLQIKTFLAKNSNNILIKLEPMFYKLKLKRREFFEFSFKKRKISLFNKEYKF